jgi:hypothetical protein
MRPKRTPMRDQRPNMTLSPSFTFPHFARAEARRRTPVRYIEAPVNPLPGCSRRVSPRWKASGFRTVAV